MKHSIELSGEEIQTLTRLLDEAGCDAIPALTPCVSISIEYLTSVTVKYSIDGVGILASNDHPAFAELRNALEAQGFIHCDRQSVNGDIVLRPFRFNDHQLNRWDRFYCAAAWKTILNV